MGAAASHLVRYVPDLVLERLAAQPGAPDAPHGETFRAAALFADVAGFTALTERLAVQGPRGAEQVAGLLNGYFGRLLDTVMDAGGDVLKLAGDAALVVWPERLRGGLEAAVEDAVATALRLQDVLRPDGSQRPNALLTRIAVCAGELSVMHVGGVLDRWELLVSGPAVDQIAVSSQAAPGEVVLSADAAALFTRAASREPRTDGAVCVRAPPWQPGSSSTARRGDPSLDTSAALRSYLPGAVRARIDAGQLDWLAELRAVAVLFIKLFGAKQAGAADLHAIHAQVRAIQSALYRYEGSLNKLSVDEKGVTALAAMGLPPFAHEDDALRAVRASRRIQEDLLALGARCSIGVAHGRVFSGVVGGARRCEYTTIGDVVNLAARLMQAAGEGILCDAATYASARHRFAFDALGPIAVKGKAEPVDVFAPNAPIVASTTLRPIVGRQAELARVAARFARGGVLVIEGDAGIGKSRLLAESSVRGREAGLRPLRGATDPTERGAAYHAWRPVFAGLVELERSGATTLEKTKALVGSAAQEDVLPLLDAVLPLGLADSALTAEMQGDVRADNTRKLLVDVLRAAAERFRIAVLLEDMHWMDSASLGLVLACARELTTLPLVMTTRPLGAEATEPELQKLLADPATERMRLAPLEADDIATIVSRALGATSLADGVIDVVGGRAQGNAFFCEELAKGLRDAGVVMVRDGEARLAEGVDLDAAGLPRTIDAVITSRVDRLSPDEQLTLKVASVIGRVFEHRVLHEVHPSTERARLRRVLLDLEERELIAVDSAEPEPTYAFRHALIVDAVYGLMLFAQRQQLHRAVAACVERLARDTNAEPPHGLLAHHWVRAGDDDRALVCLERAGEHALRSGAYAEAARFLADGLRIASRTPARHEDLRTGRIARQLGEAQLGLGQLGAGVGTLEAAVEWLDGAPPWAAGVGPRLARALLTQVARRALPGAFGGRRGDPDGRAEEAARAWRQLFLSYLYTGDAGKLVAATLIGMNRAEDGGPSAELAHAYASGGLMARLAGLEGVARAYAARATEVARAVG
ncbi:MAG TPA: adenylate/guanylate cyclase domain-containing protein, partial [Minicystis sp.]|nr:adenylate/guanylate cyclase domain-containing protein [Minicystis sp.]